jgi:hypothetical protein
MGRENFEGRFGTKQPRGNPRQDHLQHTRLNKMENWHEETRTLRKLSKKKSSPCAVLAAFANKHYPLTGTCSEFKDHVKAVLEEEFNSIDVYAAMTSCGNSSSRISRSRSGCAGGNCGD